MLEYRQDLVLPFYNKTNKSGYCKASRYIFLVGTLNHTGIFLCRLQRSKVRAYTAGIYVMEQQSPNIFSTHILGILYSIIDKISTERTINQ